MKGVNWLGVILGLIVGQILGFLWYGVVFEQLWLELSGVVPTEDWTPMIAGAGITLVTVVGLAILIARVGASTLAEGAKWGLFAAIFFAATTVAMGAVYGNAPFGADTWTLFAVDAGFLLVYYAVVGALIAAIKRKPAA